LPDFSIFPEKKPVLSKAGLWPSAELSLISRNRSPVKGRKNQVNRDGQGVLSRCGSPPGEVIEQPPHKSEEKRHKCNGKKPGIQIRPENMVYEVSKTNADIYESSVYKRENGSEEVYYEGRGDHG